MDEAPNPDEKQRPSFWHLLFRLEKETCLFILASALDVFMTYRLLWLSQQQDGGTVFVESNRIADYFFRDWGFKGMVYFKFTMVTIVCVITQVIARKNLRTARRLLNFATVLVSCVVVYSLILLLRNR